MKRIRKFFNRIEDKAVKRFSFLGHVFPFIKNKYFIASTVFLLWILLFDQNDLIDRVRNLRQLKELETAKEYYIKKIQSDSKRLKELQTDNKTLEKFAREQYYMKKKNEDIFIIEHKK